ncbi:MAG TPA: hypothetical protein VG435_11480 [Acidimicrobiales bacterium]|nr:hypothetical protein [Acidimicrobiales bacterium]
MDQPQLAQPASVQPANDQPDNDQPANQSTAAQAHAIHPANRTVNSLKGRILFWSSANGQIAIDAMTVPARSEYLPGRPVTIAGTLPSWRLSYVALITLDRWTTDGTVLRFEEQIGSDGGRQTRISDGRTWLILDTFPSIYRSALAA